MFLQLSRSKLLTLVPVVLLRFNIQDPIPDNTQTGASDSPDSKDLPPYFAFAKTISQRQGLPSATDLTRWLPYSTKGIYHERSTINISHPLHGRKRSTALIAKPGAELREGERRVPEELIRG